MSVVWDVVIGYALSPVEGSLHMACLVYQARDILQGADPIAEVS